MTKLSLVLKKLIPEHRLNTSELARLTGVLQPVLHRMVTGETDNPKIATLLPIAKHFNITVDQLMGEAPLDIASESLKLQNWHQIPLLDWPTVSQWPNVTASHTVETNALISANAYALTVKDSTMSPRFPVGTLLIIDADLTPANQDFAVIELEPKEEPTFRQVFFDRNDIYLKPSNPDFKTIHLEKTSSYRFLGVVVESKTALKQKE